MPTLSDAKDMIASMSKADQERLLRSEFFKGILKAAPRDLQEKLYRMTAKTLGLKSTLPKREYKKRKEGLDTSEASALASVEPAAAHGLPKAEFGSQWDEAFKKTFPDDPTDLAEETHVDSAHDETGRRNERE